MFNTYGVSGTPVTVNDEQGSTRLIEIKDDDQLEWLARGVTARMGGVAYVSDYLTAGMRVSETTTPGMMSLVKSLSHVLRLAEDDVMSIVREVTRESIYGEAWSLFEGKITDVQRRIKHRPVFGHTDIDGLGSDEGSTTRIKFQNKSLGTTVDGSYVATAPDLITVLDRGAGGPTPTENLRYGARIRMLSIRTSEIIQTPAAFDV